MVVVSLFALTFVSFLSFTFADNPGDYLLTAWCNNTDPRQQFSLSKLPLIVTSSGNCLASTFDNTSLIVVACNSNDEHQRWVIDSTHTYISQTLSSSTCNMWNLQSLHAHDYVQVDDAVALWTCSQPGWNSMFTITNTTDNNNIIIGISHTENNNNTPTDLCVSTVAAPVPPLPTPELLAWQNNEMACFLVWNMATMVDSQGCGAGSPPPISEFIPSALDTDQWVQSCKAMGGSRIVLTVKHMCGFLLFPVQAVTPNYLYTIENLTAPYTNLDIMDQMFQSCQKYGISPGVYYSITENSYCNVHNAQVQPGPINPALQLNVTQEEYDLIVISQLTELYGKYKGLLGEQWYDGGIPSIYYDALQAIVTELQPQAVAYQGQYISNNPVRWIGSESGFSPYPTWSTCDYDTYGSGSPNSADYFPVETDFTILNDDTWFYDPTKSARTSSLLRSMYETSVGHNSNVIIGFAPFPNGTIPMDQQIAASTLGKFIQQCYESTPIGNTSYTTDSTIIAYPSSSNNNIIDRIMIREDLTYGQRIRSFTIHAELTNGTIIDILQWVNLVGTAIGNKFIVILPEPIPVQSVTVNINMAIGTSYIRMVTLLSCNSIAKELDDQWNQQFGSMVIREDSNKESLSSNQPKWRPYRHSKA